VIGARAAAVDRGDGTGYSFNGVAKDGVTVIVR